MVYAIGPISGCHLNPAVTVGVLLSKKMQPRYAPGYLVAQVIGAMLAAGILLLIATGGSAPYDPAVAGFAANGYGEYSPGRYNLTAAFLVEVVAMVALDPLLCLINLAAPWATSAHGSRLLRDKPGC
jgi:aquaporin Z